jgi:hypothetical protein
MSLTKKVEWGSQKIVWGRAHWPVWLGGAQRFAMLLALGLTAIIVAAQNPAPPKATEELPPGPMQAKATTSCLECHEARIILQQRLGKGAWAKEVDKMVKWGAVVDASDHDALIDYLSTNFSPDQPPYEPPRTSIERTSNEKRPEKASATSAAARKSK